MNLLQETIDKLNLYEKKPHDVAWVGSADGYYAMPWSKFAEIANVEYNNGYGAQEVAADLVLVGKDWWMERYEYDGAEYWVYKSLPRLQYIIQEYDSVISQSGWRTLDQIETGEDDL